jgi:putative Mn2+ efflux pump MntP
MKLDLRLPIGLMFTIFGAILTLYGLVSGDTIYQRSLGINVNLWWGLVLLVFGVTMLTFSLRGTGGGKVGGPGKRGTSP